MLGGRRISIALPIGGVLFCRNKFVNIILFSIWFVILEYMPMFLIFQFLIFIFFICMWKEPCAVGLVGLRLGETEVEPGHRWIPVAVRRRYSCWLTWLHFDRASERRYIQQVNINSYSNKMKSLFYMWLLDYVLKLL